MIQDIINELKDFKQLPKAQQLQQAISDRLQVALKSYYQDLEKKFEQYNNYMQTNMIRAAKSIIK